MGKLHLPSIQEIRDYRNERKHIRETLSVDNQNFW